MKSATNHVLVIVGTRRTGKTTELVGLQVDAAESPSSHVCFMSPLKPGPEDIVRNTVLVFYAQEKCPVQAFLDIHGDKPISFTHLFIDNVPTERLPDVLHLAKRLPELNIAVSVRT